MPKPQPVQTFDQPGIEAFETCVYENIAKLENVISDTSVKRLARLISPSHDNEANMSPYGELPKHSLRTCLEAAPELDDVIAPLLTPLNLSNRFGIECNSVYLEATGESEYNSGHIDRKVHGRGISAIVPLVGGRAVFGASFDSERAMWVGKRSLEYNDNEGGPDIATEYGRGDVLLVRQAIAVLNGEPVGLAQVRHAGWANTDRLLFGIDFKFDSLYTRQQQAA